MSNSNAPASVKPLTVLQSTFQRKRIQPGAYRWVNRYLLGEKVFPITPEQVGEWECKIFPFDRLLRVHKTQEIIEMMSKEGFVPAEVGHLLAFGEAYPKEGRGKSIIALGSVARIWWRKRVPEIWDEEAGRGLGINLYHQGWTSYDYFLGVRPRTT